MSKMKFDSPIEEMLVTALFQEFDSNEMWVALDRAGFSLDVIESQWQIGPYRVDFYLVWRQDSPYDGRSTRARFVVECDGHDFHDRTKEQARNDRERDRFLARQGIQVIRFTGSEIFAEPRRCARELITLGFGAILSRMPQREEYDPDRMITLVHSEDDMGRHWTSDYSLNVERFPELYHTNNEKLQ